MAILIILDIKSWSNYYYTHSLKKFEKTQLIINFKILLTTCIHIYFNFLENNNGVL